MIANHRRPRGKPFRSVLSLVAAATLILFSPALTVIASTFNDLENNPNAAYIEYLGNQQIINGYPDGSYQPDQTITRSEAATMLVQAMGVDTSGVSAPFPDVASDYWGYSYIAAAYQKGYVKGFEDGSFRPEQEISRAEALTMVLNLSHQSKMEAALPAFNDLGEDHWAAPYVATSLAAGMFGMDSGSAYFYPDQPITRGEMARALAVLLTTDPDYYTCNIEGQVTSLKGDVSLTRDGQKLTIAEGTSILGGDKLHTGADSFLDVSYPDGSAFKLESGCEMTITSSVGRRIINTDGSVSQVVEDLKFDLPS